MKQIDRSKNNETKSSCNVLENSETKLFPKSKRIISWFRQQAQSGVGLKSVNRKWFGYFSTRRSLPESLPTFQPVVKGPGDASISGLGLQSHRFFSISGHLSGINVPAGRLRNINLHQRGIMNRAKIILSNMPVLLLALFLSWGCAPRDEQKMLEESTPQTLTLEVSLAGSSRAERFLGSYDQIDRLALDIVRNYGNKKVVSDRKLEFDQATSKWVGTVDNLIVDFDYTITGHAYRDYVDPNDNWTSKYTAEGQDWVEIFTGAVQHTVVQGTNTLALRLSPILDNRELTVPRITRINRPFQMEVDSSAPITVTVDTVKQEDSSAQDAMLSYRFRPVDNLTLPVIDGSRGSFSPDSGEVSDNGSGYPDIISNYSSPSSGSVCFTEGTVSGQCPQKLQIRVSNLQEIGVSSHFTVYVTDNESAETTIDSNPVIESLSGERVGRNELKWTIYVSDDDLFDNLTVNWEYLFGESRDFSENTTDKLTDHSGRMQTVMEYDDTDEGMLLVTVCETDEPGYTSCAFQNDASTSIQFELMAYAYPETVICDENGCELPNSLLGDWYSCYRKDGSDRRDHVSFTSKGMKLQREVYSSDDGTCSGTLIYERSLQGKSEQNSASAMVYPTRWVKDSATGDNLSVYEVKTTVAASTMTLHDSTLIADYNSNQKCGDWNWLDNISKDVLGCKNILGPEVDSNDEIFHIFSLGDNNTLRAGRAEDNATTYPDSFQCRVFSRNASNYPAAVCDENYSVSSTASRIVAVSSGTNPTTQWGDNLTSSGWQFGASNVVESVTTDNGTFQHTFSPRGITFSDGQFIAVDSAGSWESSDGVNWGFQADWDNTSSWFSPTGIAFGNGRFVAVSSGSNPTTQWGDNLTSSGWQFGASNVVESVTADNGTTIQHTFSPQGITYSDGQFIAVDNVGSWQSTDGVSWSFQANWDNSSTHFAPTGVTSK